MRVLDVEIRLLKALEAVQANPTRETTYEFMFASAQAFRQGVGLGGIEIDRCFDKVYGRKGEG